MKVSQLIAILQQRNPDEELFILSTDKKHEKLSLLSGVNVYLNKLCFCTPDTYLEELSPNEENNQTNLKKLRAI